MQELDRISILEACGGAFKERVDRAMGEVVDNILDLNTSPNAKRSVTITMRIAPSNDRSTLSIEFTAKTALAPAEPVGTTIYITSIAGTGEMVLAEKPPQIPGQLGMDGQEQQEPKIIKFNRSAG